ncbi:YafY family protein [Nocardioides sp.]|uniref:helix-turn-helix transcriptional regulator n=1 Tax=Nocardioides sp. TaxID=35761 RepID=UPI002735EA8F|nr:WYL domain-containing protein [Nocardioides sp.]MDP3890827.1 WYL domain-containing protein [Nocardioides sp.]
MRADRLVATLLVLQSRGKVTAAALAEELEVSLATARRDLEALATAGIPVYSQPGRGGGWQLVGGARTDLTGLSSSEAHALFLLVGPAEAVSDEAKSALRKLVRALPSTLRAEAAAAATATVIDPSRWGEVARARPAVVDELQTAVVRRRRVRLSYTDARGSRSERLVEPWGLVEKGEVWYLVAGTERGRRTFRVARIASIEVTDDGFEPPDEVSLTEAWAEVVEEMEGRRSRTWATVLIEQKFVPILRDHFGRHCHVDGECDDGRAVVRLGAPTPLDLARNLAGWGGLVDVTDPPEVREVLARIGKELSARYG